MDSFLTAVHHAVETRTGADFASLDAALVDAAASDDGVKEVLYALVDTYPASDDCAYRQAILEGIGRCLTFVDCHPGDARQTFALDDHLMLAMFFNELSTVTDPTLFCTFASALASFYKLAAPVAYEDAAAAAGTGEKGRPASEEDTEAKKSIQQELVALRQGMAKRLCVPTAVGATAGGVAGAERMLMIGSTRVQAATRASLDCLMCMLRAQFLVLSAEVNASSASTVIVEEIKESVEGLMGPLATMLEEQQQQQRNPAQQQLQGTSSFARDLGKAHGAPAVPASLLTSVIAYLEEILWYAEQHCNASTVTPAATTSAAVFRHTVSTLLGHLQRYLTLQQHRQMELAATSAGGGDSGAFGRGEALMDVMRLYSVQHAVQRVLSVASTAASTARHGKAGEKEAEAVRLLTATLSNALQAALAAFGGPVVVRTPRSFHEVVDKVAPAAWTPQTDGSHVCLITNLLANTLATGDDVDFAEREEGEGAAYLDEDEEGLMFGATREPLLKSTVGPVTAAALADMVMQSVAALDRAMVNKENLRTAHVQGLEEMQYHAARRAQREEIEKQRMIEQQGVEAIPATKLLDHVRDSANIQARGMATMRRVTARAVLEKAAFSSVLRSYAFVKEESEATVRAAQALIGRCLVQLPSTMADAALDEIFVQLQSEFKRTYKWRHSSKVHKALASPVEQMHSYYQLIMQILFTFAAAQAPVHERGEINPLLLYADGSQAMYGAGAATTHMTSHASFAVDTENPIAFLQDESIRTPSYQTSAAMSSGGAGRGGGRRGGGHSRRRKRARRDMANESGGEESNASGSDGDASEEDDDYGDDDSGGEGEENSFFFLNDTARAPCPYSQVLCRLLELAESCKLVVVMLDVLVQAPMLTRYVWNYIYRRFCLSTADQERCNLGFRLLSGLATRRPVYRTCAVNLLLHLCMSRNDYARRVAIISVGQLLSTSSGDGKPVVPVEVETALVRYAKKQLAAIPGYQFTTVLRATRESGSAALDDATIAALQAEEDKKAQEVLGRHLGLFLKLCVRQPRSLFAALLDVYKQCVERNNEVMVRLLPAHKDVQAMIEVLLESDPAGFLLSVVPFLRRFSADASLFVQSLLWIVGNKLRALCSQAKAAAVNNSGGGGEDRNADYYRAVAMGMLEHARAMYDMSRIPLGASARRHGGSGGTAADGVDDGDVDSQEHEDDTDANGFVLRDIRFLAPFFSVIPASELKQRYLPAFLYFVQVQLQFQRFYTQQQQLQPQQRRGGPAAQASADSLAIALLSAKERRYVLTHDELKQFIALVVREVVYKAPFPFDDGASRGMSPVELFVYLHRSPQESLKSLASASPNQQDGPDKATNHDSAAITPPIGIVTTKEVVSVCLELTRTFVFESASPGTPKLYGPEEVQRAIKRMMHPPPVPSQLMATVLLSISALYPRGTRYAVVKEFLHFVVVNVLTPLERVSAWEIDEQLWKGVQLFMEKFYAECSGFMVNLPDQVLIKALREHPRLAEKFRAEHGNNASFGHILGNV